MSRKKKEKYIILTELILYDILTIKIPFWKEKWKWNVKNVRKRKMKFSVVSEYRYQKKAVVGINPKKGRVVIEEKANILKNIYNMKYIHLASKYVSVKIKKNHYLIIVGFRKYKQELDRFFKMFSC